MKNIQLSKKDTVAINRQFGDGYFENESSLDYALGYSKHNIHWTKQLAYLIRAILIDHAFVDGNKRTSLFILLFYIHAYGYDIEEKKALAIIKGIVLNNKKTIKQIREMIEDGITKTD